MYQPITNIIETLDTGVIASERLEVLQSLIDYIKNKRSSKLPIRLNFICTHNSRRSHLSQVWARTMAAYFNIGNVNTYSGGTEASALFPKVVDTLANQGFEIANLSEGKNPVYAIKHSPNEPAVIGFSKAYGDTFNPSSDFAAIMTCSAADEGCPMVFGCDKRIALTYEDPKLSDGTEQQTETYINRSLQIATEMKFVFSSLS